MTNTIEITLPITSDNCQVKASQLLSDKTGLSQAVIKDAMHKGAVWLLRGKGKTRLRRASKPLKTGDVLALNYNQRILATQVPTPKLIADLKDYSVWFKPYGLSCQGSRWGDFSSINRWVEVNLPKLSDSNERPVFLVHRLDRATSGLMLLCHTKQAARLFSDMFAEHKIDKRYQAIATGDFSVYPQPYQVDLAVDGKPSSSIFSCVKYQSGLSLIDVKLLTGRKHQIRQHLSALGHPILGDRLYGQSALEISADDQLPDLQLQSVSLAFDCPLTGKSQRFTVAEELKLKL